MDSVLIDTNIWIDIVLKRPAFFDKSFEALLECIKNDIKLFVVATSVKDIFYWVEKSAGESAAYAAVEELFHMARVASVDEIVCKQALALEKPDYEDGIVAACAIAEGVDAIVTRDKAAFENFDIDKLTPQQLIELL